MNRRNMLKGIGAAGAGLLAAPGPIAKAQQTARRGMPPLKITDVKVIMTQPAGSNLVVVKVMTSEPGLYGVGCATHAERPFAVAAYIEKHLKPFVVGKNCDEIEDIWQSTYVQSYFRAGVTGNNALSGIDGALWDILGKRCGVPVYQLLGGKVRTAVPLYGHAAAREPQQLEDQVRKYMEQGYRHVRVQLAVPGFSGYGVGGAATAEMVQKMRPTGTPESPVFEPNLYVNTTIKMFDYLRSKLGFDVELLHRPRAAVPQPGLRSMQGRRALPPILHGGSVLARGRGLVQGTSPADDDVARDGRTVREPQRVAPASLGAADRFHPDPPIRSGRPEPVPQDRRVLRVLQRAHGLARSGQRGPDRSCLQPPSGPFDLQLRDPGRNRVSGAGAGGVPGNARDQRRVHV
jgi:hypothetical protein